MDNTRIYYLVQQLLQKRLTDQEQQEFNAYVNDSQYHDVLEQTLTELTAELEPGPAVDKSMTPLLQRVLMADRLAADDRLTLGTTAGEYRLRRLWKWGWAAAVAVLIGAGAYFWHYQAPMKEIMKAPLVKDITPGANKAILTLADGATVTLDSAGHQVIQQGATAVHQQGGRLQYEAKRRGPVVAYNTLATPRGGQFQVVLSDGTKVWLNSESSLTYPEVFIGSERKVVLSGEAYFEVSRNEQQPFAVHTDHAIVNVLGTQFNLNAYQDESAVKATLLQGSIRLSGGASTALLSPGEQGVITGGRPGIEKKHVNVNQEVAWKSGYFIFRNSTIQDIMRQVGRWYDIEVEYRGGLPRGTFGGIYSKNKDLQELLKGLELTGLVHFKIEGRRVIVMT